MNKHDTDWEDEQESHENRRENHEPKGEEIRSEDLEYDWEPSEETEDFFEDDENWKPGDEPEDLFEYQNFDLSFKDDNTKLLKKEENYETTKNISYNIRKIKEKIRNIDWDNISEDWKIKYQKNQYPSYDIQLDPKQDSSRANPLYKHKKWLETVYNNKELNVTDKLISEVCGVHLTTIQNWRKIHDIPAKDWTNGKWVEERGYVKILMPKGYLHPELVPNKGRNVRFEHVIVMEKYLSEHPELEWSKEHLIDEKYLKMGTIVHHVNFKKSDNRLENLWLYENISNHKKVEKTLTECFRDLIKLNLIGFENGNYYLNTNFDYRKLSSSKIKEILKPISINPYKDIKLIKEEIKKINWNEISDNWDIKIRENQPSEKEFSLDPFSDCSDENPLYLHNKWVDRLVHDKNFNLTQRRLAKLCGVDRGVIFYWSKVKHNINMENERRGFGKRISSAGRIWMKLPESYGNPISKKNKGWMYEHRYKLERYLADHPELEWSKKYLIDGKYLKSECLVHHINFDPLDNRLKNLWICKNNIKHRKLETSLTFFVDDLLKSGFIIFRNGIYNPNL
jgi:hypothetical protein